MRNKCYFRPALLSLAMKKIICFSLFALITGNLLAQHFSQEAFANRRHSFAREVRTGVAFIPSVTKEGRLNKNFYYLTGIDKPGYVYVFDMQERGENGILFAPDQLPALEALIEQTKTDKKRLILSAFSSDFNQKYFYQAPFLNADSIFVYKRAIKDEEEIVVIREACRITAEGIKHMYKNMRPGMTEQDLFALMEAKFIQEGGNGIAFQQVASGNLGTTPHAGVTDKVPGADEMIVLDIGALKDKYTADVTVSFTISGKFTKEQQTIYDIIYKSLDTGVKAMVMGNFHARVEQSAQQVIIDELYKLGLITNKDSPWQRSFWIQHGFGHHIGLDVHDVWYDYLRMIPEDRRVFMPGMILTFEPALYFPKGGLDARPQRLARLVSEEDFMVFANQIKAVYQKYEGFAVRLEECILIKADGTNENLTKMSLK
ncbi:MAG: M24 family metallopeptidase [Bacteroidales bacterium]|nr:M24 family metallopeptidase [Bacteroidales bacterium]MCL2738131.1 M24 family metallopeptidase [Bacteroidales bacterium]